MAKTNPTRALIVAAIEKVQRYDRPMNPAQVRANVEIGSLSLDDLNEALRKHINAQIPIVMKELGLIITDQRTRERKFWWTAEPDEIEEQLRIKEQSSDFDKVHIACERTVLTFLREKEKEFGYKVYPGLFHSEIDRIYAMHGLTAPGGREAA